MLGVRVPPGLPLFGRAGSNLPQRWKLTKKKLRKLKASQGIKDKDSAPLKVLKTSTLKAPEGKETSRGVAPALPGKWAHVLQFLKEVRAEFDKIAWSNRKETVALTSAVVVITIFFTGYLGLVDIALSKVVGSLIG